MLCEQSGNCGGPQKCEKVKKQIVCVCRGGGGPPTEASSDLDQFRPVLECSRRVLSNLPLINLNK